VNADIMSWTDFKNPHNTQDPSWLPENSPTVNLEYPNKHAQERYEIVRGLFSR